MSDVTGTEFDVQYSLVNRQEFSDEYMSWIRAKIVQAEDPVAWCETLSLGSKMIVAVAISRQHSDLHHMRNLNYWVCIKCWRGSKSVFDMMKLECV